MRQLKILALILLLSNIILADKVITFPGLIRPFFIDVDDNKIYVTDGPTIYIYSSNDFKLLKKFGKEGEGPREFKVNHSRNAGSVVTFVQADHILVNSVGRVTYFTKEGEYIKEAQTGSSSGLRFQMTKGNFVGESFLGEKNTNYVVKNLYDSNFKFKKELYRRKNFYQVEGGLNPFYSVTPIVRVYNNRIFISGDSEIYVFAENGEKIYSIKCEYDKLPVTEDYKKGILNWYKTYPGVKQFFSLVKSRLKFPKYFPVIRMFHVVDQKVYVLTYKKKGDESEFVIFDINGKFFKKIMVPFSEKDARLWYPYTIEDDKLYQLIENLDKKEWDLHIIDIK
jgi:hypothetical protein